MPQIIKALPLVQNFHMRGKPVAKLKAIIIIGISVGLPFLHGSVCLSRHWPWDIFLELLNFHCIDSVQFIFNDSGNSEARRVAVHCVFLYS